MSSANPSGLSPTPGRARKRPPFELSEGGFAKEQACSKKFQEWLRSAAALSMKRRESRTLDETDFGRAFEFLVASQPKSPLREVVSAISTFAAGGALGYGVTLVTQGGASLGPGWIIIVLAALSATLAALFLHWQPAR